MTERYEVCRRNYFIINGTFYGMLVAKQFDTGRVIPVTRPTFVTFTIPKEIRDELRPERWPKDRPASIYFRREGNQTVVYKVHPPIEPESGMVK